MPWPWHTVRTLILGRKKTCSKILTEFFWPGGYGISAKHVRIARRKASQIHRRAPFVPLPTIKEPFRSFHGHSRSGPLRKTNRGHKFIFTIMDFATRYSEAIPLRRTDAATIAEVPCGVFTRLGLPAEILRSNQVHVGANHDHSSEMENIT